MTWASGSSASRWAARRPIASLIRASSSAGPQVCSTTSSMPQSWATTARPPSVTMSSTGTSVPVVRISRHRSRAWASSWRPSTRTRSGSGASIRALPSAGRILTWWLSRARPGSTSAEGWRALVSSSRVLMAASSRLGRYGRISEHEHRIRPPRPRVRRRLDHRPLLGRGALGGRRGVRPARGHRAGLARPRSTQQVLALHRGSRLARRDRASARCWSATGPSAPRDPAQVVVEPGATVEFLPPFAGG